MAVEHLFELGVDNFIAVMRADSLNLVHEEALVDIVRQYINIRDAVVKKAKSAEAATKPELWALLTDEEKKTR